MKILFICPKFHGYEEKISNEILRKKHSLNTIFYDEKEIFKLNFLQRCILFFLSRTIKRISINMFYKLLSYLQKGNESKFKIYFEKKNFDNYKYDRLLVIKGYGLSKNFIDTINADKKILYQWDSLLFYPYLHNIYDCFDAVFTFDKLDSKNGYGVFLPNFYEKFPVENQVQNDLFYIGTYTKERYEILQKIVRHCEFIGMSYDIVLIYSGSISRILKSPLISKNIVSKEQYRKRFMSSKMILELSNKDQVGATQRLYEALGNKKIVISDATSNYSISYDDFLSMSCIDDLLLKPQIPSFIFDYEISNWLDKLLDNQSL